MAALLIGYLIALGCWFVLFSPWGVGGAWFWAAMAAATGVLVAWTLAFGRRVRQSFRFRPRHVAIGVASAAALYGAFLLGDLLSTLLLDFAAAEVDEVYDFRRGLPAAAIAPLLLLWIAPAEELFWRGFIQPGLAARFGRWAGFLAAAALYALVHLWAANLMLLAAALLCGLCWGFLRATCDSLWPGIISHALWDVAIFILAPIG